MDFNPLVTPNNVVTGALNATLITHNGNENVLLNDIGNGRVETAFLPEGYVPLGTAELGGIIYIVSYNPLTDKCLIGSFPSPERNVTSNEIQDNKVTVQDLQFHNKDTGDIYNVVLKVKLLSDPEKGIYKLNPGDKYIIYSTNGGIVPGNGVSDVGNEKHKVDSKPSNVTIHVVSIGEDGRIVYLDDSLVWTEGDGSPAHYYIRNISNATLDMLDSYRTLVSSAYNVFNSKVSGELALLFELKVINTFSLAWDAEVKDDGDKKKAMITFIMNYTSDHPDINMTKAIVTGSTYTNNLNPNPDPTPNGNNYLHLTLEKNADRKNDGTDLDIKAEVTSFTYDPKDSLSDHIWNYEVTPAMSFGKLDFLSLKGSINFLEIGSGKTELDEWRYYIENENFYLKWGLSAYPEINKEIKDVTMTFIPFDEIPDNILTDKTETYDSNFPLYTISGKSSYSGYFLELLPFNEINSRIKNAPILKDYLYLVDICINYGSIKESENIEHRHNYRWLYTTGQWNDVFVRGGKSDLITDETLKDSEIPDFSVLTLDPILKLGPEYTIKDNIKPSFYTSKVLFPKTYDKGNKTYDGRKQPYAAAGSLITTISYDEESKSFDTTIPSIETNILTKVLKYSNLFNFDKLNNDSYNYILSEVVLNHDEFQPISDTKESSISEYVIPKISEESIEVPSDLSSTISLMIETGILDKSIDDKGLDSFTVNILESKSDGFDLNVIGALFSRINADLQVKGITVDQEIRPFIYTSDDYIKMGLDSYSRFATIYKEKHGDAGKGDPFYFEFSSSSGDSYNSKDDWDPSDDWSRLYWWDDIPPYNDHLNSWMMSSGGCFQIVEYEGGNGVTFDGKDIQSLYGLWARTSEGHYVPINCFSSNASELATLVSSLYGLLYYVNTDTEKREMPVVVNVNYMAKYSETLNIDMDVSLSINDILNSIKLIPKNDSGNISLNNIINKVLSVVDLDGNKMINTNNISAKIVELKFDTYTISHKFRILDNSLYEDYDTEKSTIIPAIALLSTALNWERCTPRTKGSVYIHDTKNLDSVEFKKLDAFVADRIKLKGSIYNTTAGDNNRVVLNLNNAIPIDVLTNKLIYNCFLIESGLLLSLLLSRLLTTKAKMRFRTDSHGNPWSTVHSNAYCGLDHGYQV